MISIEMPGIGQHRVRQTLYAPAVYFDHWALRRFSERRELADRLVAALHAKQATLLVSTQNFAEFAAIEDPHHARDAEAFLASAWTDAAPRFVITERARDDRPIGCIGIHDGDGVPELGYWLTPEVWGRGYATEAGRAVVALARDSLRLKRLRASWLVGNPASGRVLRKLGFTETGRIVPQPSRALGRDVDTVEMALDLDADEPPARMPIAA